MGKRKSFDLQKGMSLKPDLYGSNNKRTPADDSPDLHAKETTKADYEPKDEKEEDNKSTEVVSLRQVVR